MLETILDVLKKSDNDGWSVMDTKTKGWEFYFIRHNLDQNRVKNVEHVNVTVYKKTEDRYLGKASAEIGVNDTREEAEKAVNALIEHASLVRNPLYTLSEKKAYKPMEEAAYDIAEVAENFITAIREVKETAEADVNSYEIFVNDVTARLITSTGIDIEERYPSSMSEVVTNARNEKQEIELYRMYHSGTCDKEGLRKNIEKTLQYGKDRLQAVPTPALNKCDVVFSTSDAVRIYQFFIQRLSTGMVYQKFSNWKLKEEIDPQTRGDKVTIEAKRMLPDSSLNLICDEEGQIIEDRILMKDNVPCAYWGERMSSQLIGVEDAFSLSNVVVSGGTKSEAEVRSGRYLEVVEFSDFQVSPITGNVFGEIRLGYLHEGDKVTIVTGGSVSGTMLAYLKNMVFSREQVQYDHIVIPSVTKLMDVTVTGAGR